MNPKRKSTGDHPSATRSGEAYCPEAGDLIWLDLDPTREHEQAGRRPALVLSPYPFNRRTGLCVACAVTSRVKGYGTEVAIPPGGRIGGVVLAHQVAARAWAERGSEFVEKASADLLSDVRAKLAAILGID